MANKKVVEMLDKNLASLIGLAKKWLVEWNIPLNKIFHVFYQMKKSDLQGLINGTHEIVKKRSYPKQSNLVFKTKKVINLKEFFNIEKSEENQYHWDGFKKLLNSIENTKFFLKRESDVFKLPKAMNDFDILSRFVEKKLVWESKEEALAALSTIMIDEYCDGRSNIAYYVDEFGELCYINIYWVDSDSKWHCYANIALVSDWDAWNRVFYPAE